ncbi:PIN domain-containing protein [Anaerospora hongkongensis]|uniref:PIN domain-containing protein n=1 Tax=Anaerospora hongkongensis TaxID=244830 RepID=UPI00289CC010|nr:PIN domain-containing protein [Anaerospora hongkongensis]
MNVFLDTTVTCEDPFFFGNMNRALLKVVPAVGGKIYISDVVLQETRHKFEKKLDEMLKDTRNKIAHLGRFTNSHVIHDIKTKQEYLNQFDQFYENLIARGVFERVPFSNDILPTVVNRAIHRIKPFSEKKDEFRDCIIWLSYAQLAEEQQIDNCFLITNNRNDYCVDEENLYDELLSDTRRFKVYVSARALIESEETLRCRHNLLEWAGNVTKEDLKRVVNDQLLDTISSYVDDYYQNLANDEISYENYCFFGYAEPYGIYDIDIASYEFEGVEEETIIWGTLEVEVGIELYQRNSFRDPGEDDYFHVGSSNVTVTIEFSATIPEPNNIENFEVDSIYGGNKVG